jgi:hypothetical protein
MNMTRRNKLWMTAASLMALAVLIAIPGHGAVGSANSAGTANAGGTILGADRAIPPGLRTEPVFCMPAPRKAHTAGSKCGS